MQIRTFEDYTLHTGYNGKSGGVHPYFEMLCIAQGSATLEWLGGAYEAFAPGLFMLPPNTPHRLASFQAPLTFWYIELDLEDEETGLDVQACERWNRMQREADYGCESLRPIRQAMEAIQESLAQKRSGSQWYDEQLVLLDVRKTVRLIRSRVQAKAPDDAGHGDRGSREFIQKLLRHMETCYYEPIDLTALSKRVHLTPSYLVRSFRQETGVTPMQYLNGLRLSAAISYLASTDLGVQRIAEATGFNSIHYFSRLFKRHYGVSPQQWRMANRK